MDQDFAVTLNLRVSHLAYLADAGTAKPSDAIELATERLIEAGLLKLLADNGFDLALPMEGEAVTQ